MFLSSLIVTVFMNIFRSRSEVFFKLRALKNFAIFRIKKDSNTSVSCEYCQISKNGLFTELRSLLLHFFKSN